jgi:ankyrin repeat protein
MVFADFMELLEWNKKHLCRQNKDLSTQRDENGSTPVHFAVSTKLPFEFLGPSRVCRQVFQANPDVLYEADHAGFFPIHVAASVGAFKSVDMFVKKCPGSAGL